MKKKKKSDNQIADNKSAEISAVKDDHSTPTHHIQRNPKNNPYSENSSKGEPAKHRAKQSGKKHSSLGEQLEGRTSKRSGATSG